jgi:hypothetical protein
VAWYPTTSVVVSRALALAEAELSELTFDDLELPRIDAEADTIEQDLDELGEPPTEAAIESIRSLMARTAALTVRAGTVFHRSGRLLGTTTPSPAAYVAAAELMDGRLFMLSRRIGDMIMRLAAPSTFARARTGDTLRRGGARRAIDWR